MSTRSNILVTCGDTRIFLYRHMDGYPAENGIDIADALSQCSNCSDFIQKLLDMRYRQRSYETKPSRMYEITTDWHGDIAWAYLVSYNPSNNKCTIGLSHITLQNRFSAFNNPIFFKDTMMDIDQFISICRQDKARREQIRNSLTTKQE
jgi:hypothetical protein